MESDIGSTLLYVGIAGILFMIIVMRQLGNKISQSVHKVLTAIMLVFALAAAGGIFLGGGVSDPLDEKRAADEKAFVDAVMGETGGDNASQDNAASDPASEETSENK